MTTTTSNATPHRTDIRRIAGALQLWATVDLIAAIACTTRGGWLAQSIANELVSRGMGYNGEWVGYDEARKTWVDHTLSDCPTCKGRGYHWCRPSDPTYGMIDCRDCRGTGDVTAADRDRILARPTERDYSDDEIKGIDR